jgi:hypothetical protein
MLFLKIFLGVNITYNNSAIAVQLEKPFVLFTIPSTETSEKLNECIANYLLSVVISRQCRNICSPGEVGESPYKGGSMIYSRAVQRLRPSGHIPTLCFSAGAVNDVQD